MLAILLALALDGPVVFELAVAPIGAPGGEVAAVDVDADGLLDLVIVEPDRDRLTLLRQSAPRVFEPPVSISVLAGPAQLLAADFDLDGDVDLAVGHPSSGRILVLANDGAGAFSPLQTILAPPTLFDGELHDVDGDGAADLLFSALPIGSGGPPIGDGVLVVVRNVAGLQPTTVELYDPPGAPTEICVGDVDQDGSAEVVHGQDSPSISFQVWEIGAGGQLTMGAFLDTSDYGDWCALVDVDGDGDVELVEDYAALHWIWSIQAYPDMQVEKIVSTGGRGTYVDLDRDGDLDLVADDGGLTTVRHQVAELLDPATYDFATPVDLPTIGDSVDEPVLVDLDGDLWPDLVTTPKGQARVEVAWNLGPPPSVTAVTPTPLPSLVADGAPVAVDGTQLNLVTGGRIAGVPLVFGSCDPTALGACVTSQTAARLEFVPPPLPGAAAGAVELALEYSGGSLVLAIPTITPATPVLATFDADGAIQGGGVLHLAQGGAPGAVAVTLWSPDPSPSKLFGLVTLEIGAGFATLFNLTVGTLGPDGHRVDDLPIPSSAAGLTVHLELVEVPAGWSGGALATSAALTVPLL